MWYSSRVRKRISNTVYNVTNTVAHIMYWTPVIAMLYTKIVYNSVTHMRQHKRGTKPTMGM